MSDIDSQSKMSGLRSIMTEVSKAPSHRTDLTIGNPAPLSAMSEFWRGLFCSQVNEDNFKINTSLYGLSRGTDNFITEIIRYFSCRYDWQIDETNVVVGAGAQSLIFAAVNLFTRDKEENSRNLFLPMQPEYTGYYNLLSSSRILSFSSITSACSDTKRFRYRMTLDASDEDIGMMLISNPSNPTGRSYSAGEFDVLTKFAEIHDIPLVVDNAYGAPFPHVAEPQTEPIWNENIINVFSMSKAGIPGARIGFAIGPERYIEKMVSFIANSAIHAPLLSQFVCAEALYDNRLDKLCSDVVKPFYASRRLKIEKLLQDEFANRFPWSIHESHGGMFCWIWIDHPRFDDLQLFEQLARKLIFIMPGHFFFTGNGAFDGHSRKCFRISLSQDLKTIRNGISHISDEIENMLNE